MEGNNCTAKDLWDHIFGDRAGFLATFTGEQSGKPNGLIGTRQQFFKYPEQIDEAAAYLQAESNKGRDAYFGVHLFKSATTRTKENAADELTALWIEADEALYSIGPTAIVESSPGRFHYYYALTRTLPAADAEELNRRLAADIAGDSGWGLSKVLRVPGTMNYKRETPTPVTCDIKGGAYDPDELARMVPELARPVAVGLNHSMEGPPVALNAMEREVYEGKQPKLKEDGSVDRSASLMKIGRTLHNAGAKRPAVVGTLQERDEALYGGKYAGRPGEYHRIFSKLEQEGRQGRFIPRPRRKLSPVMDNLQGLFAERLAAQNFELTDMGNADRFDHLFGDDYIYIPAWRKFLVWEGTHWTEDLRGKMGQLVERMVRTILLEAAQIEDKKERDWLIAHAKRSQQTVRIKAVLEILKHRRTAAPEDLNIDHYLLNCQNGTLDLEAEVPDEQRLRPYRREDLITKLVPVEYDPKAKAPLWGKTLRRVLPNVMVRDYV